MTTWVNCLQKKTLSPYKNVFIQLLHQIILSKQMKKITEKNTTKQSATRLRPFIRPTPGKSNVKLFYSNCSYNVWLNTQEIKLSIPVACTSKSFYLIPFRRTANFASKIVLSYDNLTVKLQNSPNTSIRAPVYFVLRV